MTTQALRKLHKAEPFRPFVSRLGDGQALPVRHPEFLAYSPNSWIATVYAEQGSFELVDLLITGLEVSRNGRRRSTKRKQS
jgi:hypothetical protein